MSKGAVVVPALTPDALLKRAIRRHFTRLGFKRGRDGTLELPGHSKAVVRQLHGGQRKQKLQANRAFVDAQSANLLPNFANGDEIDPTKIQLVLRKVRTGSRDADLFRFASLTWSVPVSNGFGRRLRYLVWDKGHNRLAGLIALGDPVFNLSVRDNLIGWTTKDRSKRLVRVLDAYVLGAVPPYNQLLGGKAVASLVRTSEVARDFRRAYGKTVGIISGKAKHASLLAVTTTSSMGRSSIYNRLKLGGETYFTPIGYTVGWGHFHITDELFEKMRAYLRLREHSYADQHEYGEGPNWRLRTIRAALTALGVNQSVLKHGVQREVFISAFATNAFEILRTGKGRPDRTQVKSVAEVSRMAVERWMAPRAVRRPEFKTWKREAILELIEETFSAAITRPRTRVPSETTNRGKRQDVLRP